MRQKKKLYLRVCCNESTQSFSRCTYIKVSPRLQISRCIFMVKLERLGRTGRVTKSVTRLKAKL